MSTRLKIPDNLVGKYVHQRFDNIYCNLVEDFKLHLIELIPSLFPETTVQIISRIFENDTIEIIRIFEIDSISMKDTLYISCVSDEMCIFELDIQSTNGDVECCNNVLSSISTALEFENQTTKKYNIAYPHNLFY